MTDFLQLPSLKTLTVDDNGDYYQVNAVSSPSDRPACPQCGAENPYGHGSINPSFIDTPTHGKKVIIATERKRYRCRSCLKTFVEPIDDLDETYAATKRLVAYIKQRVFKDTFSKVAREVGLDEKTVRNIFAAHAQQMGKSYQFETPRVLGIDELGLLGTARCIVTNIEQQTICDLLPARTKEVITPYFQTLKNQKSVEVVTMDMWKPYKDVAQSLFPKAAVVVDKFHISKNLNDCFNDARKSIKGALLPKQKRRLNNDEVLLKMRTFDLSPEQMKTVQSWCDEFGELGHAYAAKESFMVISDQHLTKDEARREIVSWLKCLDPSVKPFFEPFLTSLSNWQEGILNGFEHRYTNAYTESMNRIIKDKVRIGRGYSFDVIRALMVYDQDAIKAGSTSLKQRVMREKRTMDFMTTSRIFYDEPREYEIVEEIVTKYYGAKISTLCDKLEAGVFE
jgi:transposase